MICRSVPRPGEPQGLAAAERKLMNDLTLRLNSGVSLVVPASLASITTYVLLEQEEWFEKETAFLLRWLRSGMTVIDIGANLGVYSLPLARQRRAARTRVRLRAGERAAVACWSAAAASIARTICM